SERGLDVRGAGVMALNEVAIVGVRNSHAVREVGRGTRMKRLTEFRRRSVEIGYGVGQRLGRLLGLGRTYAYSGFRLHYWPLLGILRRLKIKEKSRRCEDVGRSSGRSCQIGFRPVWPAFNPLNSRSFTAQPGRC